MILELTRHSFGIPPEVGIFGEVLDVIILSIALGYIFSGFLPRTRRQVFSRKFDWNHLWLSISVAAPAVILHEAAHKFVALAFGVPATFYASYGFLLIGVFLKLVGSPFLFIVPGFVAHAGTVPSVQLLISISGPLVNGMLWFIPKMMLKYRSKFSVKDSWVPYLILTQKINGFLFWFNLLPIRPFDGGNAVHALFEMF